MNYFPVRKKVKKQEFTKMLTPAAYTLKYLPSSYSSNPPAVAIVYKNEIHLLGGAYTTTLHTKLDVKTDATINVGTLPFEFNVGSAVVLNDELHLLGSNREPTKHYKWDGETWTEVSTLPFNVSNTVAVALNGEIHLIGGANNSMAHYKWDGETWTQVGTAPWSYLANKAAVVLNGDIHLLVSSGNDRYHYKWDGETWTQVGTQLPFTIVYKEAATDGSTIYVRGNGTGFATWTEDTGWVNHAFASSISFNVTACNVYFGGWHNFWNATAGTGNATYHAVVGVPVYIPIE